MMREIGEQRGIAFASFGGELDQRTARTQEHRIGEPGA